jgi:hypothetical protein
MTFISFNITKTHLLRKSIHIFDSFDIFEHKLVDVRTHKSYKFVSPEE